jgi:hypothetical protein
MVTSLFCTNFDEVYASDVIKCYANTVLPAYLPTQTRGFDGTSLIACNVSDIGMVSGITGNEGGGIFSQKCVSSSAKRIYSEGWGRLYTWNNNFQSLFEDIDGNTTLESPFDICDIGAGHENVYRRCFPKGGAVSLLLAGSAPVRIQHCYVTGWGANYGILADASTIILEGSTVSGEARAVPCLGAASFGGNNASTEAVACSFDASWLPFGGLHLVGANPVNIVAGTTHRFTKCGFSFYSPATELIHVQSESINPVIVIDPNWSTATVEVGILGRPILGGALISSSPIVVARGGGQYEQYGGRSESRQSNARKTKNESGRLVTATAVPREIVWDSTATVMLPLENNVSTRIVADIVATGYSKYRDSWYRR